MKEMLPLWHKIQDLSTEVMVSVLFVCHFTLITSILTIPIWLALGGQSWGPPLVLCSLIGSLVESILLTNGD